MDGETTKSGGNAAAAGGPSAGKQSGPGADQRASGSSNGERSQPEEGTATGNLTTGVTSPQDVGLAKVFQGGPGAGAERASGSGDAGERSQPDQAGQPKGNPRPEQSNDNVSLPAWVQQLPKKLVTNADAATRLAAFKTLDEFVQAYLDASAQADGALPVPGKDSAPEQVQAFYERLGKPKEAAGYSFAKNDPAFAQAAFAAHLSGSQAEAVYKAGLAELDDARKGIQAALARDYEAADADLRKEYGDRYNEAIVLMKRGLGNNPKTGALSPVAKALVDAGLAGKPEIVRAFIELGRATSEGAGAGGSFGAPPPKSVMDGRGFAYQDNY